MINIYIFFIIIFIGMHVNIYSQTLYRSGMFLHHSTGESIWGPNGSNTSVPQQMIIYNQLHGYTGNDAVTLDETWFPSIDNEWFTWHQIFDNSDPNNNILPHLQNNKIIIIKSCYPSSNIVGLGAPGDTLSNPSSKTVYNYKWHWRNILRVMRQCPENFFVIWTNAPLVPSATNNQEASLSNQFCSWAKDTLAMGIDPIFGAFPSNVYVFDFFHKLADANGMLQLQYASSSNDSHPNSAATELVAPQFVQEIFNASIVYEGIIPVELTSFSVLLVPDGVEINWSTATELNNFGFDIERCALNAEHQAWEKIGFVNGQGTTAQKNEYSFVDNKIDEGVFFYRLKQIDFDGSYTYSNEVKIDTHLPKVFSLEQNYPNPFNPITKIKYKLPQARFISIIVYDVIGNEIAILDEEFKLAGNYEVEFNSLSLSSGIYFYRLNAGDFSETRKMILMR